MSDTIARGGLEVFAQVDFSDMDRAILQSQAKIGAFNSEFDQMAKKAGGAGKGVADSLKDADAATQRFARSLQLAAAQGQLTVGETALLKASLRGLDTEALRPLAAATDLLIAKQAAAGKGATDMAQKLGLVGITAGQARTAMQQLPAQFTDIFTSLASGQPALTVFLQQGGQIKDTFGGAGNALRALGSVLTPVRLALGGAAAAIVGLGLAYKQGSAEADEYRRALVLTGNAAGATVSQLQNTAEAVSRSVGTQSQAAEVVAQLAASGRVAAGDIGKLAEAAIRLERVGGPAAEETAKAFAELGKEPAKAVEKLNESTNFLTVELYRQIKALEEQGRAAEAAALAQTAYADAVSQRARELEGSLGTLERAWRGIADTAKAAWDAMLNVGRKSTPQQEIERLGQQIESLTAEMSLPGTSQARFEQLDRVRQSLLDTQSVLQSDIRLAQHSAQAQGQRTAAVKASIEADKEAAKARKKANDELQRSIEAGAKLAQSMVLEQAGLSGNFLEQWQNLNAAYRAGRINVDALTASQARLIETQKFVADEVKRTVAAYNELVGMQELRAEGEREIIEAEERARKIREDAVAQFQSALQGLQSEAEASRLAAQLNISHAEAIARVTLARLEDERVRVQNDPQEEAALLRKIELQRQVVASINAKDVREANAKAAQDAAREWERTVDSIRDGLTDAFRRAFESGEDFGTAFAKTIANEIKARVATALAGALANNVLALAGVSSSAMGGAGAQGGTNWVQMAQTGQTLYRYGANAYNWATGSGAAMYSTSAGTVGVTGAQGAFVGEGAASGVAAWDTAAGASSAGSGSIGAAGWAGWVAAAILGAMKASSDWSEGFRRDQAKDVSRSTGLGAFGYAFGGFESDMANFLSKLGFSDRLADLLTGSTAVAKIFGYAAPKISASGVTGTLGGGDFSGNMFADVTAKAGVVRKLFGGGDKRETILADLPDDLGRFLDTASKGIFDKAEEYGKALGLPVDALAGITTDIKVTLTDDAEKNMQAITEALGGYGEALVAGYAEAIKPLALYGETTVQTIERVGSAIVGVNEVLDALGVSALAASIDGGKAAIALQEMFGGVDGLRQAASGYLQNFYTEAERVTLTTDALAKEFGKVGLVLPTTRDGFRDLVEAQVLTTESGRAAFATLMNTADAFDSVMDSADALSEAAAELARKLWQGLSAAMPDFVSPRELANFRAGEVQSTLAGAGINASIEQILGSSREDIIALWKAVGDKGQEAILEAYGAWQSMHDAIVQADIAAIVEPLGTTADELLSAYNELVPSTDNLVAAWRDTKAEVEQLSDALAEIDGTAAVSAIDALRKLVTQRDGLRSVIDDNNDQILSLRVSQGGQQAVSLLRQREASLWAEFASTNNPELARAITQTTLQRIALESDLQADANKAQMAALKEQISAAERLRDIAAQMGNFVLGLQAGNLSNLGYAGRLAASERLFSNSLQTGMDVQGNAQAYLQNAQSAFGGATGAYSDVFESVTGRLQGIGATDFGAQVSDAQAQLQALESVGDNTEAQILALGELNTRFGTGLEALNGQIATQTQAVRDQIAELKTLQANQERQILQFGLALSRLITAAEATAGSTGALADASDLAGAEP